MSEKKLTLDYEEYENLKREIAHLKKEFSETETGRKIKEMQFTIENLRYFNSNLEKRKSIASAVRIFCKYFFPYALLVATMYFSLHTHHIGWGWSLLSGWLVIVAHIMD
jgi:hypothetical protein